MTGRGRARLPALVATLAVGLLLTPAARAGPREKGGPAGHRHGPPPLERVLERHAERLGLDAETRARIREIAEEARAGSDPLHDELHRLRGDLHALLSVEEPDEARVMELAGEIGDVETALRRHRLRTMLRIRALLTPEQRAALVELYREKRREEGGPPPPD